jgi:hypothetical protein
MTALPAGWKPKDPAHAARILEALVSTVGEWNDRTGKQTHPLNLALVEGAKAVLEHLRIIEKNGWHTRCINEILVVMAQAYAPRMAEAGMEVPE